MMRRIWCVLLLLVSALLLAAQMSEASTGFRVDEAATRLLFHSGGAETLLAVHSSLPRPVTARVDLELINELNRPVAKVSREVVLKPGSNTIAAEFQLEPSRYVLWQRLRYQVITNPPSDTATASGVISLSQICPDMFQLSYVKPGITAAGARCHIRVRAEHPVTFRPIEGVRVSCELVFENLSPLTGSGTTDPEGYAEFNFDLPSTVKRDGEIKLTATRNGLSAEVTGGLRIDRTTRISLSTDKNIYQPGQTLHVRALAIDPSRRALNGAELTLKILDPEDTIVHRASLKTSRFGIASDDWAVPANIRLGDYQIKIDRDESDEEDVYTPPCKVRISRYELPNFTVNAKPDRGFYLSGQNAEVEVRGEYLFGQPVIRGHVRIVRETDREWNYREQKWEIGEDETYDGELDSTGRFVASVNLSKQHDGLSEHDYERFKDLTYAAYITDPTTNRTEQRRFDLRVTREAIHVYVIDDGSKVRGEPVDLFVSASYADGTPAECEVEISQDLSTEAGGVRISSLRRIRTVRTNRRGVARATGIVISEAQDKSSSRALLDASLDFVARDRDGRQGHGSQTIWSTSSGLIRVHTNKALYKPGESVAIEVTANGHASTLFIDVTQHWRILQSQTISLVNGRGRLTLPYRKEFTDEVSISASGYPLENAFTVGTRTVLFPRRHDLKLGVKMSQSQYRPGEQASVAFQVQTGNGQATESAIGVTVVDRAVEERARTDAEFGGRYDWARDYRRLWGHDEEIAGITLKSLEELDLSKPISAELQMAAEILLLRRGSWLDHDGSDIGDPQSEFGYVLTAQLKPVKSALDLRYLRRKQYPSNAAMLTRELADFRLDFPRMLDPWGIPYIPRFSVSEDRDVFKLISAGPDKRAGNRDDFTVAEMRWPYFRPLGEAIDRAVLRYHNRTGSFIRDRRSLKRELLSDAIDLDALRDRWGKPYRFDFGVSGNYFTIEVESSGEDRRFDVSGNPSADDFTLWTSKIDYFAGTRAKIDASLASYFRETNRFPQEETELKEALARSSIDWDNLRDPWGNRYYASFRAESRYSNRIRVISFAQYRGEARQRTEITPVTQRQNFIYLRSNGEDGRNGTRDDFEAGNYSRVVAEQSAKDPVPVPSSTPASFSGATGAITGVVVDPMGAVISNAVVKATHRRWAIVYESRTDDSGRYLLGNLRPGVYEVNVSSPGFVSTVIVDVPVNSSSVTEVNATLMVGATTETVTVCAGKETVVETTVSATSSILSKQIKTSLAVVNPSSLTATPRLREYFPETLVWQPSIETDAAGLARLNFKLADNITTWKMSVIASTEDGEIGTAEKEILAFQPFFVEHDPPRILTEGDEIALPVVLRNYLDKTQAVDLEIKPEPWFKLLGPARKRIEVAAGNSARETFGLRAVASVDDGKQRITASGSEASDAIEKPVTVHPHGQEITQTATQVFSDSVSIPVTVPEAAIPRSARAELKIYPNLMAHVIESIEGIMKRPHGCGEQTISSAYPSLLMLRYLKSQGDQSSELAKKARRYVDAGYERLLNYRDADGGFTYWGTGAGDPALTAYALRFLSDARDVTAVDEDIIKKTRDWLINHQVTDGSWPARFPTGVDRLPAALRTAFIARVLASSSKDGDDALYTAAALKRALNLLRQRIEEIDEPYLIACYAVAAMNAGEKDGAARAIEKLRALVHHESDASYWALQTNTPFYGWGIAGRIEATALTVQALASFDGGGGRSSQSGNDASRSSAELVNRGLLFLLRQKDREGGWYSTQATVDVLDSLLTVLGKRERAATSTDSPAEIIINDKQVASIPMPPPSRLSGPILTDISPFLTTGSNRIQIRRRAGSPQASAQVVESHYELWPAKTNDEKTDSASAGAIRLRVNFDKTEAKIGDEITCTVHAERVGFRGYGMLLAEVGLPPGADLDRASLDRAVKESGIDQYDILPDRLIVYLWPEAGGTQFQFKLKARFGLIAHTAPSVVYDYYNPEAKAVVAPTRFIVK